MPRIDDVRHAYLHFQLDGVVLRNMPKMSGTNQLLESVRVVERVEKVEDGVEHAVLFLTKEESIEFLTGTGARVRERTAVKAPNPIR